MDIAKNCNAGLIFTDINLQVSRLGVKSLDFNDINSSKGAPGDLYLQDFKFKIVALKRGIRVVMCIHCAHLKRFPAS